MFGDRPISRYQNSLTCLHDQLHLCLISLNCLSLCRHAELYARATKGFQFRKVYRRISIEWRLLFFSFSCSRNTWRSLLNALKSFPLFFVVLKNVFSVKVDELHLVERWKLNYQLILANSHWSRSFIRASAYRCVFTTRFVYVNISKMKKSFLLFWNWPTIQSVYSEFSSMFQ